MKKKLAREFRGFETNDDIRENLFYEKLLTIVNLKDNNL